MCVSVCVRPVMARPTVVRPGFGGSVDLRAVHKDAGHGGAGVQIKTRLWGGGGDNSI